MNQSGAIWQYVVVFIILAGIIVWILVRLFSKKHRNKPISCCGCSLAEKCSKVNGNVDNKGKKLSQTDCRKSQTDDVRS